jgi:hypothetical protein
MANTKVTQELIADDAIGADQLAASAVVTASIVDDNITQAKIADDAVGADQLAASAVVTASVVDANITTAKIADDAVTGAKIENAVTIATSATSPLMVATTSARITQVALTDGTVSWDAAAAANAFLLLEENSTISAPSNAVEGAIISIEVAQHASSGPYTLAWNTVFEFAASTAPTMTATDAKTDIFSFRYNGSVWQEIGRVQNLAQT